MSGENEITVRLAYREDIPMMYEIEKRSFTTPWSYDAFEENFMNSYSVYVLAEYENEVIGFGGMQVLLGEAHIMNIAVAKDYRRKGSAQKILTLMKYEALKRSAEAMFLEVRVSNEPAKALYEKNGFERIALRKKYYSDTGEDAIVMMLRLQI